MASREELLRARERTERLHKAKMRALNIALVFFMFAILAQAVALIISTLGG